MALREAKRDREVSIANCLPARADTTPSSSSRIPRPIDSVAHSLTEPLDSLAGALTALLEVPRLAAQLRRNLELAEALANPQAAEPLPPGVRNGIGRIAAALAFAPSLPELLRWADIVDFRDLNEDELAYLEGLSIKTIRRWRTQGTGPEYRCEAGISYPIRWVWEWREKGRQRLTAQKKTRGWRE